MGYLFLIIALLAGTAKGFCGKKISDKVVNLNGIFYINILRMLICTGIGFLIVCTYGTGELNINLHTLVITAASGIFTALFVALWIICVRKGAYVMVDVFIMSGAIVTIILCNLFFNEKITVFHCLGFLLLIFGSYIMCSYSSNVKGKITKSSFTVLFLCGLCSGLVDFSQKWYVKTLPDGNIAVFNFCTYLFSALTLLIFFIISKKLEKKENDGKSAYVFCVICIMAVFLFANSYFKTMAAKYLDSAVLYPLSNALTLILSSVMASVFFKEKITKKCVLGILISLSALMIMKL